MMLRYRGHISWVTSKVITQVISSSEPKHQQNSGGIGWGCCFQEKTRNTSEMGQDRTKVVLLITGTRIGTKINLV